MSVQAVSVSSSGARKLAHESRSAVREPATAPDLQSPAASLAASVVTVRDTAMVLTSQDSSRAARSASAAGDGGCTLQGCRACVCGR